MAQIIMLPRTDRTKKKSFRESRWFKLVSRISSILQKLPPINMYTSRTKGGILIRITSCYENEEYEDALKLALKELKKISKKKNYLNPHLYWTFMMHAVYCTDVVDSREKKERLIKMVETRFFPYDGYEVSYCFCYFSRWRYAMGNNKSAVYYAIRARKSYEEWGYPDYLMGWYTLFIFMDDPIEFFRSAVNKDNEYMNVIAHDPHLNLFPHIIQELRKLEVISAKAG